MLLSDEEIEKIEADWFGLPIPRESPEKLLAKAQLKKVVEWLNEHTVLMVDTCGVRTCTFHCTSEDWQSFLRELE